MKKNKEESNIKISEKISLKLRKTIIASRIFTFILVILLICAFIGLNVWIQNVDLPQIDLTANQLFTLSDASKEAIKDIKQDIKIYVFGIEENASVVDLIKQYCAVNDKITYEMLSKESNLDKVQEFELEDGYSIVVIESGDSKKIIDASSDFHSYDYSTYAEVDTTEQTLTNSILSLVTENKPKVYFVEGHDEFGANELGVLTTYLNNEAIETEYLNIATTGNIPEDCNVLAIISPSTDFMENETQAVLDYINKGGNLFITRDVLNKKTEFVNFQKILDVYGVNVENGYIIEKDSTNTLANYPYIFRPQISMSNGITADIASDSYMWLAYAEKLNFASEEKLKNLNVTYESILETTDNALFVTDFSADAQTAASTAQTGKFTIAAEMIKTISEEPAVENVESSENQENIENLENNEIVDNNENTESTENVENNEDEEQSEEESQADDENAIKSKLVISANGRFMTDYIVSEISNQYPISYMGSNKDFAINAISSLGNKEDGLKLRKDMAGTSYRFTASAKQNRIVLAIVFTVPVAILLVGIIVWKQRKKRK